MSKWISVNDRLSENNVDVLCWYKYFRYGEVSNNCIGDEVTHWMPLPKYQEESK